MSAVFIFLLIFIVCSFRGEALNNTSKTFATHPFSRSNVFSPWLRFVWWQFRSRLSDSVEFDWIGNTKVIVKRGLHGFTGNIYTGLHEPTDMLFVLHLLRPGDVFADVGANVGSYTILSSGVIGARTVAFEPDKMAASHLRKNVSLNNIENLVTVHEAAVGPEKGVVSFTVGLDAMNRVATDQDELDTQEVPMVRLDDVFREEIPIMIKLDVEGFEEQVIAGAQELLKNPGLMAVASETVTEQTLKTLRDAGFSEYHYDFLKRRITKASTQRVSSNKLYIRNPEFVANRLETAPRVTVLGKSY